MRTKTAISIVFCLGLFLFGSYGFTKETSIHEPITQSLYKPEIWVNENLHIVWFEEDDPTTLTMYNDGFVFQLTNQRRPNSNVVLSDNGHVAWTELDDRVYLYDGEGIYPISEPLNGPYVSDINKHGQVVWLNGDESGISIYYYDGKETRRLTTCKNLVRPQITDNHRIAWIGNYHSDTDFNLFIYHKNKIHQVTSEGNYGYFVMSNRGHILLITWGEGEHGEVYYYDRNKLQRLTYNSLIEYYLAVTDKGVGVWIGYIPNDSSTHEIFRYSPKQKKVTQLLDNDYLDCNFQVNDAGQIAWEAWAGSEWEWEIFYFNGHHTIRLTDNETFDVGPRLNGKGDVVWTHFTGPYTTSGELHLYDGSTTMALTHDNLPDISDRPLLINDRGEIIYRRVDRSTDEEVMYIAKPKKKSRRR